MFVLAAGANATAVGARTAAAKMLSLVIFILECKLIWAALVLLLMDMRREGLPSMPLAGVALLLSENQRQGDLLSVQHVSGTFRGDEKIPSSGCSRLLRCGARGGQFG